jgi:hypothetical protein
MTTLSELFPQSAVKSIQTGYVDSTSLSTGSGETVRYVDVTISSVTAANCVVTVDGSGGQAEAQAGMYFLASSATHALTAQLTSATNLRISAPGSSTNAAAIKCRWKVVEYA